MKSSRSVILKIVALMRQFLRGRGARLDRAQAFGQ
jgi:hypothetical protein